MKRDTGLRILSRSDKPFKDRIEAAELLAHELKDFKGQDVVVLGIPRGGVLVAERIASQLGADLDIVFSHKLGAPGNPELAIGAVSENGQVFLDEVLSRQVGATDSYIQKEKQRQLIQIQRRAQQYRKFKPKVSLKSKIVIVTDDGLATGATMQTALWACRQECPRRLIAAIPVGPQDRLRKLTKDADETICLRTPPFFAAVGQFYLHFEQVRDEDLLEILEKSAEQKTGGGAS
jgi:predicted phosphoribosyltransferase